MKDITSTSILTTSRDGGSAVPLESVFVSIDLDRDIAHVAYEGETGIRWDELSRANGELLARLGAPTQIQLASAARTAVSSAVDVARRSA